MNCKFIKTGYGQGYLFNEYIFLKIRQREIRLQINQLHWISGWPTLLCESHLPLPPPDIESIRFKENIKEDDIPSDNFLIFTGKIYDKRV